MCVYGKFCELMDCLILSFGLIKIIAETPYYYFKVNKFTRFEGSATLGRFKRTIKNRWFSDSKILPPHIYNDKLYISCMFLRDVQLFSLDD